MDSYQLAAQWIKQSDGLLITAGAGIGVDSGLPDFRGDQGMWQAYPALGRQNIGFIDIANPQSFRRDPHMAWGFYGHRLNLYRRTQPHDGFQILRQWSQTKQHGSFAFTSNVDGQFQQAGFNPLLIYEFHGSIHHMQCADYCEGYWNGANFEPVIDEANCRLESEMPVCPQCGSTARPNILMFGDFNWQYELYHHQQRRYQQWLDRVDKLVVIEMGAGNHIPTVRHESERRAGSRLIRIDPRDSQMPNGKGISLATGALESLKAINACMDN